MGTVTFMRSHCSTAGSLQAVQQLLPMRLRVPCAKWSGMALLQLQHVLLSNMALAGLVHMQCRSPEAGGPSGSSGLRQHRKLKQ